jgi:undecaprenyl-diphosphatase
MKFIKALFFLSLIATAVIYACPRTWELDLITRLQHTATPFTIAFLQFVSDTVSFVSVGIPVILLAMGFIKSNKSLREKAFLVLFAVALAGLTAQAVKRVVHEPRPYEVDKRITQWSGGGGYGFPSGHTAEAMAAASSFSLLWPEAVVLIASFAWAFVILLSRVYLGVHDPGDVMAGIFLGTLSCLVVLQIRDSIHRARTQPPAK